MNSESGLPNRLREIAKDAGTAIALCKAAGIPLRTFNGWLAGKKLPLDKAAILAETAGVSLSWLAMGIPPKRPIQGDTGPSLDERGFEMVPVYDVEAAAGQGNWIDQENIVTWAAINRQMAREQLRCNPKNLVVIRAVGTSMEPLLKSGDWLYVDVSIRRLVADAIYVFTFQGQLFVKHLQHMPQGGVLIVSSDPSFEKIALDAKTAAAELRISGRVLQISRVTV